MPGIYMYWLSQISQIASRLVRLSPFYVGVKGLAQGHTAAKISEPDFKTKASLHQIWDLSPKQPKLVW